MKKIIGTSIIVLLCGLLGSCEKKGMLDSPVGMKWETALNYLPYKENILPASEGVYDFTCTSHKVFSIERVADGKVFSKGADGSITGVDTETGGTEQSFVNVYSNRLHTISGPWYEIRIGSNMMQVSVKANDTGEKRVLHISVGAPGGGEEFYFAQDK